MRQFVSKGNYFLSFGSIHVQFGFGFCWGLVCKYWRFLLSGDKQVWVVRPRTPMSRHRQPRAAIQLTYLRTPAARPETSPGGSGRPTSHPRTHLQNKRSQAGQEPPTVTSSARQAGSRARAEVPTTPWHSDRVYAQRDRRPQAGPWAPQTSIGAASRGRGPRRCRNPACSSYLCLSHDGNHRGVTAAQTKDARDL